jgi:hypothetical protein
MGDEGQGIFLGVGLFSSSFSSCSSSFCRLLYSAGGVSSFFFLFFARALFAGSPF